MSQQWNEPEDDDLDENERESGGRGRGGAPLRLRQLRVEAQIQSADAQKIMARATARSARYMLIAAIVSSVSAVITVVGVAYGLYVIVSRAPH